MVTFECKLDPLVAVQGESLEDAEQDFQKVLESFGNEKE